MAFDCICVDFKNKKSERNIENIKKIFPYAKILPFINSYHDIIKSSVAHSRTKYLWLLSSLIDYKDFDFNFIPEQFQHTQIHTWSCKGQKEGDTFLIPKEFSKQQIRFLRDYKDVNYHITDLDYDNDFVEIQYDLSNNIDNLKNYTTTPPNRYIKYFETENNEIFYPSYWEDLKIYRNDKNFYIPLRAMNYIQTQIYDYPLLFDINEQKTQDCFDICFISNGEPFEEKNYNLLIEHCYKNNLKNKIHWIRNIDGRTAAYKRAASQSETEYFYAVFAKSIVDKNFKFDYSVDRGKNKRHYIFHARLNEVELEYGTFNINLYSKTLTLETPDDPGLDFTLYSKHEVVPTVSNTALLCPDNYTAWKNAFREVSKLVLWNKNKPTVETKYRIEKWLSTSNKWLGRGANDGKQFVLDCNYNETQIKQSYTWDFCRKKFKELYPEEQYY
jgi:hypothetical protein